MLQMKDVPNTLGEEIEAKRWNRVQRPCFRVTSDSLEDFPEKTERDLKIFFTGTYQLAEWVSNLAELLKYDNTLDLKYHRDNSNFLKMEVESRHVRNKEYRCYVEYVPESIGNAGVRRHYCECANGSSTVGCCSRVSAVVYYLSHARYLSKIIRPAEILGSLLNEGANVSVIEEESDEDWTEILDRRIVIFCPLFTTWRLDDLLYLENQSSVSSKGCNFWTVRATDLNLTSKWS